MKVALINGSPKIKDSASGLLLTDLKKYLSDKVEIIDIEAHKQQLTDADIKNLNESDILVFSFPLYVYAIPSHLLSCLIQIEKSQTSKQKNPENTKSKSIYGITNCGFYEGIQTETALYVLKNWSAKCNFEWKYGLGVGGAGSLAMMSKTEYGNGPKATVDIALTELADDICNKKNNENKYISVGMPRFLYKLAAQMGWRQLIKSNGGKPKDLSKKP